MTINKILDVTETLAIFFNESKGHRSIRALKHFSIDSILHVFSAREHVQNPTYLSVQIDEDKHILLFPEFLQYINHSCEPNTFFDTKKGEIIAIKDINENEEVTFFYPSTEWSMTQPFECFCKASSCLGIIQGAAYLDNNSITKYRFAEHIQNKLHKRQNVK